MAEWNYEPSWHSIDEINGGFTFKSFTDISASDFNKLVENMQFLYQHYSEGGEIDMNRIYPIGSIFLTLDKTFHPAEMFGGTWTQLKNRFLVGAGDSYNGNATGGIASHNHSLDNNAYAKIYLGSIPGYSPAEYGVVSAHKSGVSYAANRTLAFGESTGAMSGFTARYTLKRGGTYDANYTRTETAATPLGGATVTSSNLPPYLAVYMWRRTA